MKRESGAKIYRPHWLYPLSEDDSDRRCEFADDSSLPDSIVWTGGPIFKLNGHLIDTIAFTMLWKILISSLWRKWVHQALFCRLKSRLEPLSIRSSFVILLLQTVIAKGEQTDFESFWFQLISADFEWFQVISNSFHDLKSVCSPLNKSRHVPAIENFQDSNFPGYRHTISSVNLSKLLTTSSHFCPLAQTFLLRFTLSAKICSFPFVRKKKNEQFICSLYVRQVSMLFSKGKSLVFFVNMIGNY